MQEDNKPTKIHQEQEVAKIRLNIAKDFVLLVYQNLAENWWWDGLDGMRATVDQDPTEPDQYILHQTDDSKEYDPFRFPLKPYKLGYVEIEILDEKLGKPVDVRLVCSWNTVLSFWQELEQILRREYPVVEPSSKESPARNIELPVGSMTLNTWKATWKIIKHWSNDGMGVTKICNELKKHQGNPKYKNLPSGRVTITKIINAGRAGLLES